MHLLSSIKARYFNNERILRLMGMFSACAKEATIREIIKWVESEKFYDSERDDLIIFYDDLIRYLEAKLKAAEYD